MSALLFGSISTVADTSEQQREAFNAAFAVHGLDWNWDREQYRSLLASSGGEDRIAAYARARGARVVAADVHRTKSQLFQEALASGAVEPRPGVVDTIRAARQAGTKVAFVTSTSPENIAALLAALQPALSRDAFDLVVDASDGQAPKPDGAVYQHALEALGEQAQDCLAIEDNPGGVQAATAAGLRCVAFPNTNTSTQHFPSAHARMSELDPHAVQTLLAG